MALKKRTREIQKNADAPEIFNGCKFWKLMECQQTFKAFPQSCGVCDGCRCHKHESLVSRGLAEAQSAAATLFVTLTYSDDEKGEYLDYRDIELFLKRIRKAGYKIRKLSAGEYGTDNGRAHWHLLLYFQWSEEHLTQWKTEQIYMTGAGRYDGENWEAKRLQEWKEFVPKMHIGYVSDRIEFMNLLADPEILWLQTIGYKSGGNYRQDWKYWPHGVIEAQLVSAPGNASDEEQNRGVRYVCKYATKDPWQNGKLRKIPFWDLPEHVRQATSYGPWDLDGTDERTKWKRGNVYVEQLEAELRKEFPSDDDVPFHRRIKRHKYNYKAAGGLGAAYFEALGGWYARNAGSDEKLVKRTFKLGPSYRKKHIEQLRSQVQKGLLPDAVPRNQFYMGDTSFRQFGRGFNKYLESLGTDETSGPKHIFDNLETQAAIASDTSSGLLGLAMWQKDFGNGAINKGRRKTLENLWGELPEDRLRGLVPKRLQRLLEDTSQNKGWQNKRRIRLENEKFGKPKQVTELGGYRIIETTQKRWFFEKDLTRKERWYRREILTAEQLQQALAGKLAPENARAIRIEKEGRGDLTPLAELDVRTVRNRIRKQPGCPF